MTSNELLLLCERCFEAVRKQEYAQLSAELEATDVSTADTDELVAKLRYLVCRWDKIPYWKSFRDRVNIELLNRKLNAKQILQGLSDKELSAAHKEDYNVAFERERTNE